MTEQESADFPDGSVGRYVRERWGALPLTPAPAEPEDHAALAERAGAADAEGARSANGAGPAERAGLAEGTGPAEVEGPADGVAAVEPGARAPSPPSGTGPPRARRIAGEPTRRGGRTRPTTWPRTADERTRHGAGADERPDAAVARRAPTTWHAEPPATPPAGRPAVPDADQPGFVPTTPTTAPRATNGAHADRPGPDDPAGGPQDSGRAEREAARDKWYFDATEIRPAAPRASAPALDGPADLSTARLLRRGKRIPQSGWRWWVYRLSGRMLNPGESPAEAHRRQLATRVNQPLLGCYKIAMLSLKGGVGKTTMTATLGSTFASMRGDRVVAVDANPDRGTLSQKIPLETSATVRHLLRDAQRVRRYTDVRAYTSQGPSRLEVLASEQDPAVSEAFSEEDYRRTITLLEHFYNIVLTDCGTGLMHSAMYGVLGMADQLVIVSSGSIDGARSASATMDWLDAHGHEDLVRNGVAVINSVHRKHGAVHLNRVAEHFAARCRAVVRVPFDPHQEEGAEVDLDRMEPGTRLALLELAAAVADGFTAQPART
ncbi:MAG: AAA family ATPase [Pseudonocardia sp.]